MLNKMLKYIQVENLTHTVHAISNKEQVSSYLMVCHIAMKSLHFSVRWIAKSLFLPFSLQSSNWEQMALLLPDWNEP